MQKNYLLLMLMLCLQTTYGQAYNPYLQSIHFVTPPAANGFECGSTQIVSFTQGLTSTTNATQWNNNPLTISICLSGLEFVGSVSNVVSGAYAANFDWSFDAFAPNCLIGVQNQTLIGSGPVPSSPNPLSFGTININVKVPENSALASGLAASVNLQVPGYMTTSNIQGDDDATAQSISFCSCYSFITNAGTIAGNQSFYNSGNPLPFTSVSLGSGGSGGSIVYQWQELNAGIWTDISGATNQVYDASTTTISKSFRRKAKRSLCGTWVNSNIVHVNIIVPNAGTDKLVNCIIPSTILGSTAVLGSTYNWQPSTGLNNASIAQPIATPLSNTTYTMTMTDALGATASDIVIVQVDKTTPSVGASATSSTICAGTSTTLNANGASSYEWTPGQINASSAIVTPGANTTYTVTGVATNGCTNTATKSILVNALPPVGSTATFNTLCEGGTTTLTGTGANLYTWNFGASYSNTLTISPPSTTTYAVIGTNTSTGCTNISTRTIQVNPLPNLNITASASTICPGASTTINVNGGSTYLWQPGSLSGNSNNVSPLSTTTYTITGTSVAGCTKSATKTIVVAPCGSVLNIKLLIQGYYLGAGLMDHTLLNEGVGTSVNQTDSIIIELHANNSPYALVASQKTILNTNGSANANFSVSGNYYIVVKHRNMVETWSSNPVNIGAVTANYDFSNAANKTYGNNAIQLENNVWASYSGDINHDENVDLLDAAILETDIGLFQFGYFNTDINGDGNVDLLDTPVIENNINAFVFSNHP